MVTVVYGNGIIDWISVASRSTALQAANHLAIEMGTFVRSIVWHGC